MTNQQKTAILVSDLNKLLKESVEHAFPLLWVRGEISNWTQSSSGHVYFTLKDEFAQIRCIVWRSKVYLLPFVPGDGMAVSVRAFPTFYETRGELQLSVETIRPSGIGDLHEYFIQLKAKLENEGLFSKARKRLIPRYPRVIGLITSIQTAALQDVLNTLTRRAPHIPVKIYPTSVQGNLAAEELVSAVQRASLRANFDMVDVLLIIRGGGSREDLWNFNQESLVRAVSECPIPVITGIGHETDLTLCDFVADRKAPTPTAAAEFVSEGYVALATTISYLENLLFVNLQKKFMVMRQLLEKNRLKLRDPKTKLDEYRSSVTLQKICLRNAANRFCSIQKQKIEFYSRKIQQKSPTLLESRHSIEKREARLLNAISKRIQEKTENLTILTTRLEMMSPYAILKRGYAITFAPDGTTLLDSNQIKKGDIIRVALHRGRLEVQVKKIIL